MKWKLREERPRLEWKPYFAWWPVQIEGQMVWLEWVKRRSEWWVSSGECGVSHSYRFSDVKQSLLLSAKDSPGCVLTKYNELLYAVGQKYPGESRHETALRYIRQAEEAPSIHIIQCSYLDQEERR